MSFYDRCGIAVGQHLKARFTKQSCKFVLAPRVAVVERIVGLVAHDVANERLGDRAGIGSSEKVAQLPMIQSRWPVVSLLHNLSRSRTEMISPMTVPETAKHHARPGINV